ncbi:MAG: hypothetical protein ACOVVK_07480, partial [Elsteraceae bacterium]
KGGPDAWELQLVNLKPNKSGDPIPDPPIDAKNPITLGVFSVSGAASNGKAPAATFSPSGAKINFVTVKTIPASGSEPARTEKTSAPGSLSFALRQSNAAPAPGEIIINPGDIKTSLDGARNVSKSDKVNYSLFAVMGDPGATTFYTVKSPPLTEAEKKKAAQEAAIKSAQESAKRSSSGAILSLFS